MENSLPGIISKSTIAFIFVAMLLPIIGFAQGPTATELADRMGIGWNIGNSMEVPGNETGWGNPAVNKQLIDAVKAAGFNTIRIPTAWNSYADQTTNEINETWLARVKEVVDYCIENDLYVIVNSHWDGGWLEEHPTYDKQQEVNKKQEAYWVQIANYFKNYDERLLFAGTNEVRANYGNPTTENIKVQESYNQTFVDAVRSTGGNNVFRNLIVQTYNTNIGHGLNYFILPTDVVENRLMVEVHYYDPYDFTLNEDVSKACVKWGKPFAGGDVCSWGQESHVDDLFRKVKEKFVDKGVPVVLGEYGVIHRSSLTGEEYELHVASRNYFLEYITKAAVDRGFVPVYWDNGYSGNNGFALFNRHNGSVVDENALNALMRGAGLQVTSISDENDTNKKNVILAYPNPFKESFNLKVENPMSVKRILILDQLGRYVLTVNHAALQKDIEFGINLKAGIYFIQVFDNHGIQALRLVKY